MVLVVDDERDVLDSVAETLEMCTVHKVGDYETGLQYIHSYTYDIVILDIMGVRGFELLKVAVNRGFPNRDAHGACPDAGIPQKNQSGWAPFPSFPEKR